jgi:hypothetical protein
LIACIAIAVAGVVLGMSASKGRDQGEEPFGRQETASSATEAKSPGDAEPLPLLETTQVFARRDPFGSVRGGGGAGVAVRLSEVNRTGVRIRVGGIVRQARIGERFAKSFRLLSLARGCAELLFGDEQFSLCEGDEISK